MFQTQGSSAGRRLYIQVGHDTVCLACWNYNKAFIVISNNFLKMNPWFWNM